MSALCLWTPVSKMFNQSCSLIGKPFLCLSPQPQLKTTVFLKPYMSCHMTKVRLLPPPRFLRPLICSTNYYHTTDLWFHFEKMFTLWETSCPRADLRSESLRDTTAARLRSASPHGDRFSQGSKQRSEMCYFKGVSGKDCYPPSLMTSSVCFYFGEC